MAVGTLGAHAFKPHWPSPCKPLSAIRVPMRARPRGPLLGSLRVAWSSSRPREPSPVRGPRHGTRIGGARLRWQLRSSRVDTALSAPANDGTEAWNAAMGPPRCRRSGPYGGRSPSSRSPAGMAGRRRRPHRRPGPGPRRQNSGVDPRRVAGWSDARAFRVGVRPPRVAGRALPPPSPWRPCRWASSPWRCSSGDATVGPVPIDSCRGPGGGHRCTDGEGVDAKHARVRPT